MEVLRLRAKILLAIIIILLTVHLTSACLVEYRVVYYKPERTQIKAPYSFNYVQSVSEDFVMLNFTNTYDFTITDVNVSYKNTTIHIPAVNPKENVKYVDYHPVSISKFNISLNCNITGNSNRFKVTFNVRNDYPYAVDVNITFPKPDWIQDCLNCQINDKILFKEKIKAKSSKSFTLIGSGSNAKLEDGTLEFNVYESAKVEFSTSIPFSIEKSYSNNWVYANFSVHNTLKIPVNVTVIGYVNKSKPPHTFNNSTQLFKISSELKPNEIWNRTVIVKTSNALGFFVKVIPLANETCQVEVYPATRIGKSYLQYGIIEGFNITLQPIKATPRLPLRGGGGGKVIYPEKPPSRPPVISTPPVEVLPRTPSVVPLIYPVVQPNVMNTLNLMGIKINQIKADRYTIATILPLTILPTWLIIPLALIRRAYVFDSAVFSLNEIALTEKIYVPYGVPVGRELPAGIEFIDPNEELTREIHELYDIPLNSAKAIALSIEHHCPVYLSEIDAVKVALNLGLEAYLRGGAIG